LQYDSSPFTPGPQLQKGGQSPNVAHRLLQKPPRQTPDAHCRSVAHAAPVFRPARAAFQEPTGPSWLPHALLHASSCGAQQPSWQKRMLTTVVSSQRHGRLGQSSPFVQGCAHRSASLTGGALVAAGEVADGLGGGERVGAMVTVGAALATCP
jgi:hypothetical protein